MSQKTITGDTKVADLPVSNAVKKILVRSRVAQAADLLLDPIMEQITPLLTAHQRDALLGMCDRIDLNLIKFYTRYRCPRCGTCDNVATHTLGRVQRRRCRRATCGWVWKVAGKSIDAA